MATEVVGSFAFTQKLETARLAYVCWVHTTATRSVIKELQSVEEETRFLRTARADKFGLQLLREEPRDDYRVLVSTAMPSVDWRMSELLGVRGLLRNHLFPRVCDLGQMPIVAKKEAWIDKPATMPLFVKTLFKQQPEHARSCGIQCERDLRHAERRGKRLVSRITQRADGENNDEDDGLGSTALDVVDDSHKAMQAALLKEFNIVEDDDAASLDSKIPEWPTDKLKERALLKSAYVAVWVGTDVQDADGDLLCCLGVAYTAFRCQKSTAGTSPEVLKRLASHRFPLDTPVYAQWKAIETQEEFKADPWYKRVAKDVLHHLRETCEYVTVPYDGRVALSDMLWRMLQRSQKESQTKATPGFTNADITNGRKRLRKAKSNISLVASNTSMLTRSEKRLAYRAWFLDTLREIHTKSLLTQEQRKNHRKESKIANLHKDAFMSLSGDGFANAWSTLANNPEELERRKTRFLAFCLELVDEHEEVPEMAQIRERLGMSEDFECDLSTEVKEPPKKRRKTIV